MQHAHAWLACFLRAAARAGGMASADTNAIDLTLLADGELALARKALALPEIVAGATEALEPHRVPFALLELAGDFHRYYNQRTNRIIDPDHVALSLARLF